MRASETAAAGKPLPEVTRISRPFWEAAAEHRLLLQRCSDCGRHQHPPVALCPACSGELEWAPASGRGTLYTFTVLHRLYHPAFADELPYNVAVVELEEGPLMVTNVVDVDNERLTIGMPLRVVFEDVRDGISLPKAAPATDG